MRALPVVLVVLLAGCTGSAPQPDGDVPGDAASVDPPPVPRETFRFESTIDSAAGFVGHDPEGIRMFDVPVRTGATGLVLEVTWNDTVQDLDAVLGAPTGCFDRVPFPDAGPVCLVDFLEAEGRYGAWWNKGGSVGMPDAPSRIVPTPGQLDEGGTGTWQVSVWAKDAAVGVPFHVFATVFYDGADTAGFTAVPWD